MVISRMPWGPIGTSMGEPSRKRRCTNNVLQMEVAEEVIVADEPTVYGVVGDWDGNQLVLFVIDPTLDVGGIPDSWIPPGPEWRYWSVEIDNWERWDFPLREGRFHTVTFGQREMEEAAVRISEEENTIYFGEFGEGQARILWKAKKRDNYINVYGLQQKMTIGM